MRLIIKTIVLQTLILSGLSSYGQDKHCLPLAESAAIHQMAYQKLLQDTVIAELEGKIVILQQEKASIHGNLTAELAIEKEKNRLQASTTEDFKALILSSQEETRYYKKKEKQARRGRNLAIGLGVILIALVAIP